VAEHRQLKFVPPPGAATILLVRHGESAPVRDGEAVPMLGGTSHPKLDPVGVEQAERLAERLGGDTIGAIYVTPLQRTAETAAPLAARLGLEPRVEPDLQEVNLGEWEGGAFRKHVRENHPVVQRMRAEGRWDVIPGAEPAEEFAARVREAIERLAARHVDERLAVFTHGGVIGQVLAQASGSRPFTFSGADNASISHLVITPQAWIIRRFNDTAHLDPAFSLVPAPLT
jgi:2,3-bisphosphoglycerate-dependent phosphoglycerate mutase